MSDIMYVLGKESIYDNLELRLSLRSLEKYAKNVDRVFIAGEKPDWIQNVVHIKSNDIYTKETNLFNSVIIACKSDISDNFLYMNDDFFLIDDIDVNIYPYFTDGEMVFIDNPSRYQEIQNKTINLLDSLGKKDIVNFEIHCPMLFEKEKLLSLEKYLEESKGKYCGYFFRTLYGNMFVWSCFQTQDCKLWTNDKIHHTNQHCISTNDECDDIMEELKQIFPKKSKYEKYDFENTKKNDIME